MTDDRQTDHAMQTCAEIGGIAGSATAIPPNNDSVTENNFLQ